MMTSTYIIHRQFCKAKRRIELGVAKPTDRETVIKLAKELGYKKIITTPHIMAHKFPNEKNNILAGLLISRIASNLGFSASKKLL